MPPSGISFEEQSQTQAPLVREGFAGFMVRKGLASNEAGANITLLVLAILVAVIALFVIFKFSFAPEETGLQSPPPPSFPQSTETL